MLVNTFRIGYLKSIYLLKSFVHENYTIVLTIYSNYIKYWDSSTTLEACLAESYSGLIKVADQLANNKHSLESIEVLHRALYAAFYTLDDIYLTLL